MVVFGHVTGHMVLIQVRGHVMSHVLPSQGHMGESLSSLFGYSLALGGDLVDLGVSRLIPS